MMSFRCFPQFRIGTSRLPALVVLLLFALVGVMSAPLSNGGVAHASTEDEELLRALVRGPAFPRDVQEIHRLLEDGVSPNAPDAFGRTAVHYAAGTQKNFGNANDVLVLLLQHGGECCMRDNQGSTPLHYIAAEGTNDTLTTAARIRTLLDNGADPNAGNGRGHTPLHFSAKTNVPGSVEDGLALLLKGGGDPNRVTGDGNTALHLAAGAPVLLDHGHGHDVFSRSQLEDRSVASFVGGVLVIRELLAAGANPDAVNADGMTPLLVVLVLSANYIAKSHVVAATEALLSGGANPDATTPEGATPLHLVLSIPNEWSASDQRLLEALLGAGADPDRKNRRGDTPLHAALWAERGKEVIEALLQAGANPCLRNDSEQMLPSELARVSGRSIWALLEYGRDGCRTAEENRLNLDRAVRRQVESCLNSLGHDTGPSDGLFDSRTSAAIREWQVAHGGEYGEVTGYLGSQNELDALLEGCRVVFTPMCQEDSSSGCWVEASNQPGCHVWHYHQPMDIHSHTNVTIIWSGKCSGGFARGRGTLVWYDSGELVHKSTGVITDSKAQGNWTIRWPDGTFSKGPYVDGKAHGHWVVHDDDGSVWEGPYVNDDAHGRWVRRGSGGYDWECWRYHEQVSDDAC